MNSSEIWVPLADAYRILISEVGGVQRLVERAERRLAFKILNGQIKARSLRAYVGSHYDTDPTQMLFPVESVYKDHLLLMSQMDAASQKACGVPNFVWLESRVLLGRRFEKAERSAPAVWQPQQELFCIELHQADFYASFPEACSAKTEEQPEYILTEAGGSNAIKGRYGRADRPLIEEMLELRRSGAAHSNSQAAEMVASRAVGGGSTDSKIRRLRDAYKSLYGSGE